MQTKEKKYLSASRISTLHKCSWIYYTKYLLKVPSKGNSGMHRGSVTHIILDLLFKDKHKKHLDKLKKDKTYKKHKGIKKIVEHHAKKLDILNRTDLEMVDSFIQVAINRDFYGPEDTVERFGEKSFKIEVNEKGKKYNLTGKIDATFICKDKNGICRIKVTDYKTSKEKYNPNDKFNIQDVSYQLACQFLWPHIKQRELEFVFLLFPDDPVLKMKQVDDNTLAGFSAYLTTQQEIIDNFDKELGLSNMAYDKGYLKDSGFEGRVCCGRGLNKLKKNGENAWHCEYKFPTDFYVLVDKEGKMIQSAFKEDELKIKEGLKIEKRTYNGCPRFFPQNYQDKEESNPDEPLAEPLIFNEADLFMEPEIFD